MGEDLDSLSRLGLDADSYCNFPHDMTKIEAITVTQRACQVEQGPDFEGWVRLPVIRHPQLEAFAREATEALWTEHLDLAYQGTRLREPPVPVLSTLLQLAEVPEDLLKRETPAESRQHELQEKLLQAVGKENHGEALKVTGRACTISGNRL